MPATLNPIRKHLIKKSLLKGSSQAKAMLDAGLSKATAYHNSGKDNKLLNTVKAEIERDITKEITVKSVLESLKHIQELAIQKNDFSTAARCEELCGKWLAMFTDKQEISQAEKEDNQFSLDRLAKIRLNNG